jgi:hypothetical protein
MERAERPMAVHLQPQQLGYALYRHTVHFLHGILANHDVFWVKNSLSVASKLAE